MKTITVEVDDETKANRAEIVAIAHMSDLGEQVKTSPRYGRKKPDFRPKTDALSEEMVAALLAKPSYDFHESFGAVYGTLRARNAVYAGEDTLRLRVYEKLQNLVVQGLVDKTQKQYFGVAARLRTRLSAMTTAKAEIHARKAAIKLAGETADDPTS